MDSCVIGEASMADEQRAERIKEAILSAGTYEQVALKTGISVSTLVRITSGKTEPKFKDIADVAKLSGASLDFLAFGDADSIKNNITSGFSDKHDQETVSALKLVINNLQHLKKEDIQAISRQVQALFHFAIRGKDE